MMKDLWFKAEEIVSKADVLEVIAKIFKTIILFIACVGVFAVLLLSTLFMVYKYKNEFKDINFKLLF